MTYLHSLPQDGALLDVLQAFPRTAAPLLEYHEVLLRGAESPFTVAERELMAAFVSSLNACDYCAGIHEGVAKNFGVEPTLLAGLIEDVDGSGLADKLKPVFRYLRKLTLTPARVTREDAEAVFTAGWDDRALHDACSVCALFNFMNRLVEGLGVEVDERYRDFSAKRLAEGGYRGLVTLLKTEQ